MPDLSGTNYSELDASNNQPAPSGMPEGMPPSGVNDAWRAGMGAIKRSYDRDHAGTWVTNTSPNGNQHVIAYSVAPAAYIQGEKFAYKASLGNSGAATVNINGLGAKNIYKKTSAGISALTGAEIVAGDIVEIEYDGTQFQLLNPAISTEIRAASAQAVAGGVLDISTIYANSIQLSQTGGGNITSFGAVPDGARRTLQFTGASPGTLINSANLQLPNGASIVIGANDVATFFWVGSVAVLSGYTRFVGSSIYGLASAATTLAGADTTQPLTAGGFAGNKSLGSSGYYKLPGGFMVQWGTIGISNNASATFTYPVAFPTAAVSIAVTPNGSVASQAQLGVTALGVSSATVQNGYGGGLTCYVLVLGY